MVLEVYIYIYIHAHTQRQEHTMAGEAVGDW